jgi:hypothetical protein
MRLRRPSRSFVRPRKQALDAEELIGARRERGRRSGGVAQIGRESGLVVESLRAFFDCINPFETLAFPSGPLTKTGVSAPPSSSSILAYASQAYDVGSASCRD